VFIIRALKTRTVSGIAVLIAGGIYSSEIGFEHKHPPGSKHSVHAIMKNVCVCDRERKKPRQTEAKH